MHFLKLLAKLNNHCRHEEKKARLYCETEQKFLSSDWRMWFTQGMQLTLRSRTFRFCELSRKTHDTLVRVQSLLFMLSSYIWVKFITRFMKKYLLGNMCWAGLCLLWFYQLKPWLKTLTRDTPTQIGWIHLPVASYSSLLAVFTNSMTNTYICSPLFRLVQCYGKV